MRCVHGNSLARATEHEPAIGPYTAGAVHAGMLRSNTSSAAKPIGFRVLRIGDRTFQFIVLRAAASYVFRSAFHLGKNRRTEKDSARRIPSPIKIKGKYGARSMRLAHSRCTPVEPVDSSVRRELGCRCDRDSASLSRNDRPVYHQQELPSAAVENGYSFQSNERCAAVTHEPVAEPHQSQRTCRGVHLKNATSA